MSKYFKLLAFLFTLFMVHPVTAQIAGLKGVNIHGGIISPEAWDTGFNIGAGVDLGEVASDVHLAPKLSYWKASRGEYSLSNFVIAIDLQYFAIEQVEGLYIGIGMTYNFLSWDYVYIEYDPVLTKKMDQTSDNRIGFNPILGYQRMVNIVLVFAELKYNLISEFDTFQLTIGVQLPLETTAK
jgi:hypothetical protein